MMRHERGNIQSFPELLARPRILRSTFADGARRLRLHSSFAPDSSRRLPRSRDGLFYYNSHTHIIRHSTLQLKHHSRTFITAPHPRAGPPAAAEKIAIPAGSPFSSFPAACGSWRF